ncbi:Phenylalanine-4-hydroxylase [Chlamydiales bacterium STE3]|nr:Phenylalanine-4-hydroxylase [Chlamydiales bacterium STE3]
MQHSKPCRGLTTTKAPFIENAQNAGQLFIQQAYELYDENNQKAWKKLYALLRPKWEKYANKKFMEGIQSLCLNPYRIPRLEEINAFLEPLTGFKAKAVSGYVPTYLFFDSLKRREFPTTITIRDSDRLDYLPEPDIFHDIAGHVPMHTDKTFASVLVRFGSLAHIAAKRHAHITNREEKLAKIRSNIQALSRFFWFSIEFGLMREDGRICVYGSGLLSSAGEIEHSVESPNVQRYPFQLEWVINQSFVIDRFQSLLFVIDSFEHLYEEVDRLERWLLEGKLDYICPGEPSVIEADLKAFLEVENEE